ncbi:MAG: hypothetical protein Tsb0021_17650 [Chlamydiales bacterium]
MQRSLLFLLIGIGAIVIALLLNFLTPYEDQTDRKVLVRGDVRGMEIVHRNIPFTLNFEQQEAVINMINRSLFVGAADLNQITDEALFEEITIYPFKGNPMRLRPIAYLTDGNLLYTLPEFHTGYLQDISEGEMKRLLSKSYDQ